MRAAVARTHSTHVAGPTGGDRARDLRQDETGASMKNSMP